MDPSLYRIVTNMLDEASIKIERALGELAGDAPEVARELRNVWRAIDIACLAADHAYE